MTIGSGYDTLYPIYNSNPVTAVAQSDKVSRGSEGTSVGEVKKTECQTCKNRTYVDGSNEGNVSFKAPGHISPSASGAVVRAHEGEHVANARATGNQEGKKLVSASVALQVSICPECGRSYVSGGTTRTTIATTKEASSSNPYDQNAIKMAGAQLAGSYVDATA